MSAGAFAFSCPALLCRPAAVQPALGPVFACSTLTLGHFAGCRRHTRRADVAYVDGFVLPVPKKNLKAYLNMARKAGKIWRDNGALEYREAVGDDLDVKMGLPFPRSMKLKRGETVVFSWIVYRSRAQRDRVNQKVMKDPRTAAMGKEMPFDVMRMAYGGFKVIVDA